MRFFLILFCVFFSSLFPKENRPKQNPDAISPGESAPAPLPSKQTHVFLDGEVLYWKPNQAGMTYCLLEETTTFNFFFAQKNQARQQHADWGLGFRVGVGIDIETIPADITGYWTHFDHTMDSITQTDELIFGTQVFFGNGFTLGGGALEGIIGTPGGPARSRWQCQLDLAEIDFGYWICFNKWFSLHPYLGLEGGWIDQKQTIHYDQFLDTNSNLFFDATITQKNHFEGIGPAFGLDGTFHFGYGFGLMGKLASCFLYGCSRNPTDLHLDGDSSVFPFPDLSVHYKQQHLMPSIRSLVGFNWGKRLQNHFALFFNAAYEVQYFWETWRNQNSFIQNIAVSDAGYGDLMIHGFTGQVQVSF